MILALKLTQHTRSLLRRRCGFWGCRDLYVLGAMYAYTKLKYQFENFKIYKYCLLQIRIELEKLLFFQYSTYQLKQSFHLANNNQSWEGNGRSCWWTHYLHLAQRYLLRYVFEGMWLFNQCSIPYTIGSGTWALPYLFHFPRFPHIFSAILTK